MADFTKESWMDPAKNTVAANKKMEGTNVKPVLLVGTDGEPYDASGGGGGGPSDPVTGATSTVTSVAASATSVTLLASEASRIEAVIVNDSVSETLYVKYGATASTTSYTVALLPAETLVVNTYSGIIDGIWSAAVGDARITEVTP